MEIFSNYGFTLQNDNESSAQYYNSISGFINQVCLKARLAIPSNNKQEIIVSFAINKNPLSYGTVLVLGSEVYFGVYTDEKIIQACNISAFDIFYSQKTFDVIPSRVYNMVSLAIEEKIAIESLASQEVRDAWQEKLSFALKEKPSFSSLSL